MISFVFGATQVGDLAFKRYRCSCTRSSAVFSIAVVQGSLSLMNCVPNPNGERTVQSFPNLRCGSSGFWRLLPFAIAVLDVIAIGFLSLAVYAVIQVMDALCKSNCETTGRWGFSVKSMRPTCSLFIPFQIMVNLLLNVCPTAFASDGAAQLVTGGYLFLFYATAIVFESPHNDLHCKLLDTWCSLALFFMATFLACMGFGSLPQMAFPASLLERRHACLRHEGWLAT